MTNTEDEFVEDEVQDEDPDNLEDIEIEEYNDFTEDSDDEVN